MLEPDGLETIYPQRRPGTESSEEESMELQSLSLAARWPAFCLKDFFPRAAAEGSRLVVLGGGSRDRCRKATGKPRESRGKATGKLPHGYRTGAVL